MFGTQQGSEVGYNPRYHGRRSYKIKVAFVSGSCELLNAGLYSGNTASNGQLLFHFRQLPNEFHKILQAAFKIRIVGGITVVDQVVGYQVGFDAQFPGY